jgi:hypothetical protein
MMAQSSTLGDHAGVDNICQLIVYICFLCCKDLKNNCSGAYETCCVKADDLHNFSKSIKENLVKFEDGPAAVTGDESRK